MASILELKQSQQEILDALFFLDANDEQDKDEMALLDMKLQNIEGDAMHKLEFSSVILCEIEANESARQDVVDKAQKRLKIATNASDRIRGFIKQTMIDFDIQKVSGEYRDIRLQQGRERVVIPVGFDCEHKLPDNCVKYEPESWTPKLREVLKLLKEGREIEGLEITRGERIMVVS